MRALLGNCLLGTGEMKNATLDKAADNLRANRRFRFKGKDLVVVHLVRSRDLRPLHVSWWKGKEVSFLGVESNGNFLLRHCDGSVRLWIHAEQSDHILAKSVSDFVMGLEPDDAA